jgi:hypothetical protein
MYSDHFDILMLKIIDMSMVSALNNTHENQH